ncbi:MAG: 50S ribosomal protein L5 [Sphaerospermopsis sp. SIO1G2]|nr:50S ribosomal protein L5 [Sphaerospermopsis sp. SIO1G2]
MAFKETYLETVKAVQDQLEIKNPMAAPKIEKIVLNMGIGTYIRSGNKDFSSLKNDLALISGQAPVVVNARKSVSNFKLREGMPVGLRVTLRGENMLAFLEKLIHAVLPRVRDFHGISKKSFDPQGNYNFGLKEHTVFPEVPQTDVVKPYGLQITIKTTAGSKEEGRALLEKLGLPFNK